MRKVNGICSSTNGAYRDSNSELFLTSQALCRLVHSRPGHLLYVVQCIYFALRSLYSALNVIPLQNFAENLRKLLKNKYLKIF